MTAPLVVDSVTHLDASAAAGRTVVSGSHGGGFAASAALQAGVAAAIFNDASIGRDRAGVAGLALLDAAGTPGAAVDYRTARIGDAADALASGILSVVNDTARDRGWRVGMAVGTAVAPLVAAGRRRTCRWTVRPRCAT